MRHTSLTLLAERGADPLQLQTHARHAHFSTTERYIHQRKQKLAKEAALMWDQPDADGGEWAGPPTAERRVAKIWPKKPKRLRNTV